MEQVWWNCWYSYFPRLSETFHSFFVFHLWVYFKTIHESSEVLWVWSSLCTFISTLVIVIHLGLWTWLKRFRWSFADLPCCPFCLILCRDCFTVLDCILNKSVSTNLSRVGLRFENHNPSLIYNSAQIWLMHHKNFIVKPKEDLASLKKNKRQKPFELNVQ